MKSNKYNNKYKCIILIIALFVIANIISIDANMAWADSNLVSIDKVLWSDSEGNKRDYNLNLGYKSGVELFFSTQSTKFQIITYRKDLSGTYVEIERSDIVEVENFAFSHKVIESGAIKIEAVVYNMNETRLDSIEMEILSDNTLPLVIFDKTQLDEYNLTPFNIALRILNKEIGEIDFEKSQYSLIKDDKYIIWPTKFMKTYDEQYITITGNGTLTFEIFDNSGNLNRLSYKYDRFGYGEEIIPTITVTPDQEYAKEVMVTISWGEDNDKNPNVVRQYEIYVNSILEGSIKNYQGSFVVKSAGEVEIRAYYRYSLTGDFNYVTKTIRNIDPIPPSDVIIRETIGYKIELLGKIPVTLSFRATDNRGIKRVYYFDSGLDFEKGNNEYYFAPLTSENVTIAIEDYAGNITFYAYVNTLNFRLINEYHGKLSEMDKGLYATSLLNDLNQVVIELDSLLMQRQPSISDISKLTERIDRYILGEYEKKLIIDSGVGNYSGAFTFNIGLDGLTVQNILLGERFYFNIGQPKATSEENAQNLDIAKKISGFNKATMYTLNLKIYTDTYSDLTFLKGVPITYTIGSEFSKSRVKVYCKDGESILEVKSSFINNIIFFDMNKNGDYFFIIEENDENKPINTNGFIINGKFYSYGLVFGVGGGIVGIITILSLVLILRKKRRF